MVKRLYSMFVILALTHLFALAGLIGFLWMTDRLNVERIEQIAEVLRGEYPMLEEDAEPKRAAEAPPVPSAGEIAAKQADDEYKALLAERIKAEQGDRDQIGNLSWLTLQRLQEDLEAKIEEFQSEKKTFTQERDDKGFEIVLETMATIEPEKARDLLRLHGRFKDADVVRIMMTMDPNRAKKIINACQTEEELLWIGRIQKLIYAMDDQSANGVDGPDVASAGGP